MPFLAQSFTRPHTGTGLYARGPISGTGLSQFRYGHFLGPVLELASMCVVPFLVPGSASSGTVIFRVPYWNWHLCVWSHFRYRALPVPVWSFFGSRTRTGIYVRGPISGTGLCQFRCGHF